VQYSRNEAVQNDPSAASVGWLTARSFRGPSNGWAAVLMDRSCNDLVARNCHFVLNRHVVLNDHFGVFTRQRRSGFDVVSRSPGGRSRCPVCNSASSWR